MTELEKRKFDVLVVGELNVDLILNNIASLPEVGKEILAQDMVLTLGSSSAIFASNISTLNVKTAFIGKLGEDIFGDLVMQSLQKKKVNTDFIIRSKTEKTGATIVLNYDEDRAMVTHPGAMDTFSESEISDETLLSASHLHLSSIFLQPKLKEGVIRLFDRAKKLGLTTSLDVQWDPEEKWDVDFEQLLPLVDVFLPNEKELLAISGEKDILAALNKYKDKANIIALKMGNKGSIGFQYGKQIKLPSFINTKVIDAIGAGDSFNAGFISLFIHGKGILDCLEFGNLSGAVNTTASGGTGAFETYESFKKIAKETFNFEIK